MQLFKRKPKNHGVDADRKLPVHIAVIMDGSAGVGEVCQKSGAQEAPTHSKGWSRMQLSE